MPAEALTAGARLGDVAEVIFISGGVQSRGQADVADHVLAVVEAGHGPQDDDGGQGRQGPDAGVGDEARAIGVGQGRGRDRLVQRPDLGGKAREQLEALIAALGGVRGEREGVQLGQAGLAKELGAAGQAVIQGNGVQAILDHGADADEAHTVREQSAQIAGGGVRHPDGGEAIVAQQIEDMQGVAPIGLRLAHNHGANLRGIADQHRVPKALDEGVKPDGVARALNPDRHGSRQRRVELFDRTTVVCELALAHLPRTSVQHGHLLHARVQIASHECHGVGPLSGSAVAQGEHSNSARPFS